MFLTIRKKIISAQYFLDRNGFFSPIRIMTIMCFMLFGMIFIPYQSINNINGVEQVNIKKIVGDFSRQLTLNNNFTQSQKKTIADDFSSVLKKTINQYSLNQKIIIVNSNAVLSTKSGYQGLRIKDITNIIEDSAQKKIIYLLNHKNARKA